MFTADRHSSDAQKKLGNMFENGHGVTVNLDRTIANFKLSARGGNMEAHLKVETYLIRGQGVEHPRVSAIRAIEDVADQGDSAVKQLLRMWQKHLGWLKWPKIS